MTEAALQSKVIKLFHAAGWLVTRIDPGRAKRRGGLVREGTADLICCARGLYVEIELKAKNGKLRPAQAKRMRDVLANGGQYFVVQSVSAAAALVEYFRHPPGAWLGEKLRELGAVVGDRSVRP